VPRALLPLLALSAVLLAGCGDTLQDRPIPHNLLEGMIVAPFPVYWLGGTYDKLAITEVAHDPGGAFTVQYGDCLQGGQGTCTPALEIVTSPDNSFLPGGATPSASTQIRGLPALVTQAGRTISIPTGGVVIDIYAKDPPTALAASRSMVAINAPSAPGEALPKRLPDTGFASTPLPSQRPQSTRPLG
jgi:hypothetical protein